MQMPVFSMALEMPFHEASIEYFCFAVSGRRGSVAGGGPPPKSGPALLAPRLSDAASFPNWQPMLVTLIWHFSFTSLYFQNF